MHTTRTIRHYDRKTDQWLEAEVDFQIHLERLYKEAGEKAMRNATKRAALKHGMIVAKVRKSTIRNAK